MARAPVPDYAAMELAKGAVEKGSVSRTYREMRLNAQDRPPVSFTVAVPEGLGGPVPVLLIVGGLRSGRENLERLPDLGPNALISFEYPYRDIIRDKTRNGIARLLHVYKSSRATAEQLVAILRWVRTQDFVDKDRIGLLGYSLGAMVAPATHVKAQANAVPHGVMILAFGGADLSAIVPRVLRMKTPLLEGAASWIGASLLHALEPAHFLPLIRSEVLIVNAEEDELIPRGSQRLLEQLTPDPKWIVNMPGEHIDPRDPATLMAVVDVTKRWLIERRAVDAPKLP
jgi:dienelactone hydrolase